MKLIADRITVNGRTSMKVWAETEDGELLPYADKVSDIWPKATREKMVENMVKDLDCTEEEARAAVQKLFLAMRSEGAAAEDMPPESPPPTIISARLPNLVDVVVDATDKPVYLFITDAGLESASHLDIDGVRYVPPELVHFPYKLPVEADVLEAFDRDTDAKLFADLLDWHRSASTLPSENHYRLTALFDLLTWLADLVDYAPYLVLKSRDTERGKTRWGQASAWVSYRGIHIETLQEANLFRWSDSFQATLFFDVKDLWKKAEKRGSEDILLSRFQRGGAKVARVLDPQAGPFKGVTYFDCYGPTLVVVNESLREPLASRSLSIVPPEASGKYPTLHQIDALPLKARCATFRARHLLEPLPTVEKPADGRLGDIMQPLSLMAKIIGGDLPDWFPAIVKSFRTARQEARAESFEARIVAAVQTAIDNDGLVAGILPTAAVLLLVNDGLPDGKLLTVQRLGIILKNLGFPHGRPTSGDRQNGRLIDLDQLEALKRKFGLVATDDDDVKQTDGHESTSQIQLRNV